MRTAEKEEKRLEDEYKAEQKEQDTKETKETKKKSILDSLRERYSEYIPPINCDTAARFKYRNSTWS